jgi:hypothetical protein
MRSTLPRMARCTITGRSVSFFVPSAAYCTASQSIYSQPEQHSLFFPFCVCPSLSNTLQDQHSFCMYHALLSVATDPVHPQLLRSTAFSDPIGT